MLVRGDRVIMNALFIGLGLFATNEDDNYNFDPGYLTCANKSKLLHIDIGMSAVISQSCGICIIPCYFVLTTIVHI